VNSHVSPGLGQVPPQLFPPTMPHAGDELDDADDGHEPTQEPAWQVPGQPLAAVHCALLLG
jgi:hypothetical protein